MQHESGPCVGAPARSLGHVPGLDGLRGIAVALVVASHADQTLPPFSPIDAGYEALHGGFLGVDLFFVLSGFLITALLLGEVAGGGIGLRAFYARRALRLLPALYVFLAAQVVFAVLADLHAGNERSSILWALLYGSNWQSATRLLAVSPGLGHLWSLAVEEQFYVVWPLLVGLLVRIDARRRVLTAAVVAGVVGIGLHRALLWERGTFWLDLFVRTDTRADALLIGALGAIVWHARRLPAGARLRQAAVVAAVVLAVCVVFGRYDEAPAYLGGLSAFAVASIVVVLAVVETGWGARVLTHPVLRLLGKVSYGLYLWHFLVFIAVGRWVDPDVDAVPRLLLALAVSAACTAASYRIVERPALRLKRRFVRR